MNFSSTFCVLKTLLEKTIYFACRKIKNCLQNYISLTGYIFSHLNNIISGKQRHNKNPVSLPGKIVIVVKISQIWKTKVKIKQPKMSPLTRLQGHSLKRSVNLLTSVWASLILKQECVHKGHLPYEQGHAIPRAGNHTKRKALFVDI
jgi:hypothetical protein